MSGRAIGSPAAAHSPRTRPVIRFLLACACERSAATLVDYSAAMDIVVETVPDAEAAVATLRRTAARYDLLVVEPDGMGGMGGYALCSWLRANGASLAGGGQQPASPRARGTPPPIGIVVLSAAPEPETCVAFGADACLSKPLSPQCFAHAIRGWLATRLATLQQLRR